MRILTLLFISFHFIGFSQLNEKNIVGKWLLEGDDINGTIYLANDWNKETLEFNDDYSFSHTISTYIQHQIIEQTIKGQWVISTDSSSIILFNEGDRFQKDIHLKTVYKEITFHLMNSNYMAWSEIDPNTSFKVVKRYKNENGTGTFKENFASYQEMLERRNKVIDANYYYVIKSGDTIKCNYKNAVYSFQTFDNSYSDIYHQKMQLYDGRVIKLTDTSIFLQPIFIHKRNLTKSGSTQNYLELFKKKSIVEIQKNTVQYVYTPVPSVGKKASIGFIALSALTTLVAAPIVAIASHKDRAKKHYLNTAGVGIIGIGVGTGSFFLFNAFEKTFRGKGKKTITLSPLYQSKKNPK